MENNNVLCESCRFDYPKKYTKPVEPQGETFCLDCYEEWENEQDK